ncbi:MAG: hypothetical protein ACK4HB_03730 [Candidatus Bipolaricaulia bacterium]
MMPDFNGHGTLLIESGTPLKGTFRTSHSLDRTNGLLIEFLVDNADPNAYPLSKYFSRALRFEGVVTDGKKIIADGVLPLSASLTAINMTTNLKLELLPIEALEVGSETSGESVRFLIPNLLFTGLECSEYQVPGGIGLRIDRIDRDRLEFEVSFRDKQLHLTLKQLPTYKQTAEKLRSEISSQWTSTLTIRQDTRAPLDIKFALECADLFLLLTSLAMGARISWVSAEVLDEKDQTLYQYIKRGTVRNRHSLPSSIMGNGELIKVIKEGSSVEESPYKNFIDRAFRSYQSFPEKQQKALRDAIESYCEAVGICTLPTQLKLTARSFEALIKAFLNEKDLMYSVRGLDLRTKLSDLLKQFVDLLERYDPNISTEFNERLSGKIENLLRRPFKVTLARILDKYLRETGNPYNLSWVREFVNARNDAVHGYEMTQKHYEAWLKGNNLLEELLMKILNYSGPYIERVGFPFDWKNLK